MTAKRLVQRSLPRSPARVALVLAALALAACSHILDVQYPGRIPTAQLDDPVLAPVLVKSVIGDFECAYSNYMSGSSVHSDEYETANSNVPLANWGERTITKDEGDYSQGTCEGNFGMQATMHTARYQSEQTFLRLNKWTDAQVPGRAGLMATARAYGGYVYTLMGEGWCQVAFDGNPVEPHTAALDTAEKKFNDAITLAQTAGNTDILNMARVGLARTQLDKKNYVGAATTAALVPAGYTKFADRGIESARRWNKLYRLATQVAAYTIGVPYRTMSDPRVLVQDAGRGAFNSEVRLWTNTKYPALGSPMRLASYVEAQLIQAEALAQQGQVTNAMAIINARRAQVTMLTVADPGATAGAARVPVKPLTLMLTKGTVVSFPSGRTATLSDSASVGAVSVTVAPLAAALLSGETGVLPALSATTQADAMTNVIEERRKELSFEGGHRLNDLLRFNIPWKIGTNPFTNRLYGTTTCWPHPTIEGNG